MRPSEVGALRLRDVAQRPGGLLVSIRRSKTDPDGYGQVIGVAPGRHAATDPLAALDGGAAPADRVRCSPRSTAPGPPQGARSSDYASAGSCASAPWPPA